MLTLFGSVTSPYVRRLRMVLDGQDYQFREMELFGKEDRQLLIEKNPTLKIPMLADDEQFIFDSRTIFRYLTEKFSWTPLSWLQENQLTVIDSANDSLVQMFILFRSGLDTNEDLLYFNLQRERIGVVYQDLDSKVANGEFANWDFPSMCLFCMLDWVAFRELISFADYPNLVKFHTQHKALPIVSETAPE